MELNECTGPRKGWTAWVNRSNHRVVNFCEEISFLSNESLAQTLIHELSHLATGSNEQLATRHEALATFLGGRAPELNGYNLTDLITEKINEYSDDFFMNNNMDYFILMKVRSKKKTMN